MNSTETLATFLGWCSVINVGVIVLAVLFSSFFHEGMGKLNAKIFGVTREEAKASFCRVFLQYRLALVFLNLVPYFALQIID